MALEELHNKHFRNWASVALGFKFLKEGLEDFLKDEIIKFHSDVLQIVCDKLKMCNVNCGRCSTEKAAKCPHYGSSINTIDTNQP